MDCQHNVFKRLFCVAGVWWQMGRIRWQSVSCRAGSSVRQCAWGASQMVRGVQHPRGALEHQSQMLHSYWKDVLLACCICQASCVYSLRTLYEVNTSLHSEKRWVVSTHGWVKYGQTTVGLNGHIWPKLGLKQLILCWNPAQINVSPAVCFVHILFNHEIMHYGGCTEGVVANM